MTEPRKRPAPKPKPEPVDSSGKALDLLIAGLDDERVLRMIMEADTTLTRKQATSTLNKARHAIIEQAKEATSEYERARSIVRLNSLYARSLHIQDYKTCLAIEKEVARLREGFTGNDEPDEEGTQPPANANERTPVHLYGQGESAPRR